MNNTEEFVIINSFSNRTVAIYDTRIEEKPSNGLIVLTFLPFLSIVILICEVIAICILSQCKTVPYQCLQISISYLLSDVIGALFFVLYFLFIHAFNFNTDFVQNSQIIIVSIMKNISSASLTALIVERVIALRANLNYILISKRAKINMIITSFWFLHVAIPLCTFTISYSLHCNFKMQFCDIWQVSRPAKLICIAILIIYDFVLIYANAIVYKIAKMHAAQIDSLQSFRFNSTNTKDKTVSERQYAAMKICLNLVTVYVFLQLPMLTLMLISMILTHIKDKTFMVILRAVAYILIKINSIINLYLYIWKIQECRMFWYLRLAKYFKRFENIAEENRIEVYNIVVTFDRNDKR